MRKSISVKVCMWEFKFMNAIKIAMILYNAEGSLKLLFVWLYRVTCTFPVHVRCQLGILLSIINCLMNGKPQLMIPLCISLNIKPTYTVQHDPPPSIRCARSAKMNYTCFPLHADAFVPPRVDTQCRRQLSSIRRQPSWTRENRGNPSCPYAVDCAAPTAKYNSSWLIQTYCWLSHPLSLPVWI